MSWSYFTNAYVAAANALSIKTWPSNTDGNIWHAMDAGGVTRQEVIYSKYKHLKQHDIYKRVTYTMLWEDAFFSEHNTSVMSASLMPFPENSIQI